ncbi:MAG TPA: SusE domain-containing protein [Phnomibacter sp.]|nr:SusE domain-containing protein [Phnomibacter sp.]
MKKMQLLNWLAAGALLALGACKKTETLTVFADGKAPQATTNTTTLAATSAQAATVILTVNWTNPQYSTDTSNYKYLVQLAPSGSNFEKPATREVMVDRTTSYTGQEINDILLNFGFAFNTAYDVDLRVISSYGNNNERLTSNVIKLRATPYKIPPKVPVTPTGTMFIIGSATELTNPDDGGWRNPVPAIVHEFAQLDETTFGGTFRLAGGAEFLVLPENGSWSRKFAVPDNGNSNPTGGDFAFYDAGVGGGGNFPGPNAEGNYRIIFDFQTGKYTITAFGGTPDSLFAIGDATAAEWNNDVNNALLKTQFLARKNSGVFEGVLNLKAGKNLKFIAKRGDWQPQFGEGSAAGILGANYGGGADPGTIIVPAQDGNYRVTVNFITGRYTLVKVP